MGSVIELLPIIYVIVNLELLLLLLIVSVADSLCSLVAREGIEMVHLGWYH